MAAEKILIVEKDARVRARLRSALAGQAFRVSVRGDGREGLRAFRDLAPDLVILGLELPRLSSLAFCLGVRRERSTPILAVTARREKGDRIISLEAGADDYVVRPVRPAEALARVKALLRRARASPAPRRAPVAGGLELDMEKPEATLGGRALGLRLRELQTLARLMRSPGKPVTRRELMRSLWGRRPPGQPRTVDQHVNRLRRALGSGGPRIVTVKNVGYRFEAS